MSQRLASIRTLAVFASASTLALGLLASPMTALADKGTSSSPSPPPVSA